MGALKTCSHVRVFDVLSLSLLLGGVTPQQFSTHRVFGSKSNPANTTHFGSHEAWRRQRYTSFGSSGFGPVNEGDTALHVSSEEDRAWPALRLRHAQLRGEDSAPPTCEAPRRRRLVPAASSLRAPHRRRLAAAASSLRAPRSCSAAPSALSSDPQRRHLRAAHKLRQQQASARGEDARARPNSARRLQLRPMGNNMAMVSVFAKCRGGEGWNRDRSRNIHLRTQSS